MKVKVNGAWYTVIRVNETWGLYRCLTPEGKEVTLREFQITEVIE